MNDFLIILIILVVLILIKINKGNEETEEQLLDKSDFYFEEMIKKVKLINTKSDTLKGTKAEEYLKKDLYNKIMELKETINFIKKNKELPKVLYKDSFRFQYAIKYEDYLDIMFNEIIYHTCVNSEFFHSKLPFGMRNDIIPKIKDIIFLVSKQIKGFK